jgi:hypothetical protein
VRVRGQLAACSGKNDLYVDVPLSRHRDYCGFRYGPVATPTVTEVDPDHASSGTTITIAGTGFSEVLSENFVMFGDVECMVLSSTRSSIECRLGTGFAGFKVLYLHVMYSGIAETNALGLTYELVLNEISRAQGSQAGGTEITITGSGFYHKTSRNDRELPSHVGGMPTECAGGWKNEASIGGRPCTVIRSDTTSLTVYTPAEDTSSTGSVYDLEVSIVCPDDANILRTSAILNGAFTYNSVLTPSLLEITPSDGAVHGGETVTIRGQGFSDTILDNKVLVSSSCFY